MRLYAPGDRVIVRTDLVADGITKYCMTDDQLEWNTVVGEMNEFAGTAVTINRVTLFGQYNIVEDDGKYGWVDEMFAGLEPCERDQIEIEDLESLFV